jgi:hypothetical protein
MELAALIVAILSIPLTVGILLVLLMRRDRALIAQAITYLHQHQGIGDPPAVLEKKMEIQKQQIELQREQAALRAAEMMAGSADFPPRNGGR